MHKAHARLGIALGASLALHGALLGWAPAPQCGPSCDSGSAVRPLRIGLAAPFAAQPLSQDAPVPKETPPTECASPCRSGSAAQPPPPASTAPVAAQPLLQKNNAPVPVKTPAPAATAPVAAQPLPHTTDTPGSESTEQAAATGGTLAQLQDRVHAAVDAHKHYPLAARRQGREGRTRVGFRLFPDGRVDGLTVLDTSGSGVLDRAALAAVRGIEPFREAGDYLREAHAMQVEIRFRLY